MSEPRLSRQERRRLERTAAKLYARQPYLRTLVEAGTADPTLFPPGRVSLVSVVHEDWCPRPSGGICRCEPELAVELLPDVEEGG